MTMMLWSSSSAIVQDSAVLLHIWNWIRGPTTVVFGSQWGRPNRDTNDQPLGHKSTTLSQLTSTPIMVTKNIKMEIIATANVYSLSRKILWKSKFNPYDPIKLQYTNICVIRTGVSTYRRGEHWHSLHDHSIPMLGFYHTINYMRITTCRIIPQVVSVNMR